MGYRLRMTLAFAVLSVASVVVFTLLFLSSSYHELKADRIASVERMTSCLAGNIYWDMHAGDTHRVDEALSRFARGVPGTKPPVVLVLNETSDIYASTADDAGAGAARQDEGAKALGSSLRLISGQLEDDAILTTTLESAAGFISAARVERDGEQLGSVFVDYPLAALDDHFIALFRTAVLWSLLLLPVLLALGWLMGRHLARPIDRLRHCMQRVGAGDLDIDCQAIRSKDEIGVLARGFEEMLAGLREKRLMEEEMRRTERLVAVGQLAAGVAHEINNPLGGLLNAVSTFKRHGHDPRVAEKTVDLLERGLRQIQTTVSALLVQARVESHPLAPADLQDLQTLIGTEVKSKGIQLDWSCGLTHQVPLPSSAVRQVLMNLLLNAIQATPNGGRVTMTCVPQSRHLELRVQDEGPGIAREEIDRLFQPFYSGTGGHGLGLWVTYQTISQLGGSIEVHDAEDAGKGSGAVIEVRLPYSREERSARDQRPAESAIPEQQPQEVLT
ncbi:HAMP domain-containing histidine kinase [Thiorhodococcus mannitoliphagus]|uniref:histidine kinase n=1 Tax=Thiorhodococcus mannitoliphagus TaxID=329406 RepID=A0A6P1DPF0_9GAMM|nr:HAMP domain-containing sensor histidine kinase [Thiorhodococcus mannitoliphagus]NEX19023.1 HAMP domain-containing histidine kinase [Thiorhodococcus mannitoliphagus]